jgi:hypothetical protein
LVAATRPNDTPDAPVKPLPVIVTVVPPPVVPGPPLTDEIAGAEAVANPNLSAATGDEALLDPTTLTSTVPEPEAGMVAVIDESEFTVKLRAATPVVPRKLVPVIVTQVLSPAGSPLLGLTLVTVGTDPAVYVKWSAEEVDDVPVYDVTVTSTVPVL